MALLSDERTKTAIADPARAAGVVEDQRLVERCLRRDAAAWDELYHHCHGMLLSVAMTLHAGRQDCREVGEEIAAMVWYRVVADDFRLLRLFEGQRGCRLNAYLAGICRRQALDYRKQQRRRRVREQTVGQLANWRETEGQVDSGSGDLSSWPVGFLAEFAEVLTPTERQFYQDVLLAEHGANAERRYSLANVRQLRSRIRRKMIQFLQR